MKNINPNTKKNNIPQDHENSRFYNYINVSHDNLSDNIDYNENNCFNEVNKKNTEHAEKNENKIYNNNLDTYQRSNHLHNSSKKKKNRLFFKTVVSGFATIAILAGIFGFIIFGFGVHTNDKIEDRFEIETSNGEIVSEIVLNENLDKNVSLIHNGVVYSFNGNYGENIQKLVSELYVPAQNAEVVFNPQSEEVFVFKDETLGQEVDVKALVDNIQYNINQNLDIPITIPTTIIQPEVTRTELDGLIQLRSEFTTSIASSPENRKHNVKYALSAFNGLVVQPEEIISFNKITGERTSANNYKDANIIVGGEYVLGAGGGVCQASTTLYNALIRADLNILEVHNHSLPVNYVPLAFDAMVSDGGYDLIFQNNTLHPLYFMTYSDGQNVSVKIFGEPLEEGLEIKTRTEEVKVLSHKGDKIVEDKEKKYINKIMFKGEYLRIRYPKQGSENLGFLQYFKNGELIEEKEIRHVYYPPQDGIIMEGTEELFEGMELPENDVKFINPQ